jgi:uncharacterized protein YukE
MMAIIEFDSDGILALTESINLAHNGIRVIVQGLDRDVKTAEAKWGGDALQSFKRFYQEWRKGVMAHADALKKTADHLDALMEVHKQIH